MCEDSLSKRPVGRLTLNDHTADRALLENIRGLQTEDLKSNRSDI